MGDDNNLDSVAGFMKFKLGLTRKNSIDENHKNTRLEENVIPSDYDSYQKFARGRIKEKLESWKVKDKEQLNESEVKEIEEVFKGEIPSLVDTEEFIDSVRECLIYKGKYEYSEEEKIVNKAAGELTSSLLNLSDFQKGDKVKLKEKLENLKTNISHVDKDHQLKWMGIQEDLGKIITAIENDKNSKSISGHIATAVEKLMANWPPVIDKSLLEHKSKVNVLLLKESNKTNLFKMDEKDLIIRNDCKKELDALNEALTNKHTVSTIGEKGETIILRPKNINTTVQKFLDVYKNIKNQKDKEDYLKYGQLIDNFVKKLNTLENSAEKHSHNKLKRQVMNDMFKIALDTLMNGIKDIDSVKGLHTALNVFKNECEGENKSSDQIKLAYDALVTAIEKSPATLSLNVLILKQAKEQGKHDNKSTKFKDDLFEISKELAEGYSYVFADLNSLYLYINELNDFVFSLITVKENNETEEVRRDREEAIKNLSLESLKGSVNAIHDWQVKNKNADALQGLRKALESTNKEGEVSTILDVIGTALDSCKSIFDPIAGRNFVKTAVPLGSLEVLTSDNDPEWHNPLNPSNEKTAGQGIAIMKGAVDTILALKKVYNDLTELPSTKVLEQTITLCEEWHNAILALKFEDAIKVVLKNLSVLQDNLGTRMLAPSIEEKTVAIKDLTLTEDLKGQLSRRLLESINTYFDEKNNGEFIYALRFKDLWKDIESRVSNLDGKKDVLVHFVDGKEGNVKEDSIREILKDWETIYKGRIDYEIQMRNDVKGKATKIEDDLHFKKVTITTHQDAKDQISDQTEHYLSEINNFKERISTFDTKIGLSVFDEGIDSESFVKFGTANKEQLKQLAKNTAVKTYNNIINEEKEGAAPRVLTSIKFTNQIATNIDKASSSFIQLARILTSIVPTEDQLTEDTKDKLKGAKSIVEAIDTIGSGAAAIAAAFAGPMAPIALLVGGVVKGVCAVANVLIEYRIKTEDGKQHFSKFLEILNGVMKALQTARENLSKARIELNTYLDQILAAKENIETNYKPV